MTGGVNNEVSGVSTAEIFLPDLNTTCSLPALTLRRGHHTQNGLLACGGWNRYDEVGPPSTCEVFTPGLGWRPEPYSLTERRYGHTSWTLSNGSVLLLGGIVSGTQNTTELVTPGVGTSRGFDMKYPSR